MDRILFYVTVFCLFITADCQTAYSNVFQTEDGVEVSLNDPGTKWMDFLMKSQGLNHSIASMCDPLVPVNESSVLLQTIQMKAALNGICAWRRDKQTNKIMVKRSTGIPLYMHAMYNIERGVYVSLIFVLIAVLVLRDIGSSDCNTKKTT